MKQQLEAIEQVIRSHIHHTPMMESAHIEGFLQSDLYFKCENFQRSGSFKMRGAINAVLQLTKEQQQNGVVTHSSGNFAQALALACKALGVKCYNVMPYDSPRVKRNAVELYGGEIIECAGTMESRARITKEVIAQTGATFIHSSDNMDVITGQSTCAIEMLKSHPDLDALIVPVGGGGLLAGTILAVKSYGKSSCLVYGAEPLEADDAYRSFKSGILQTNETAQTIADGLRTDLAPICFPIIQQAQDIILVRENEIVSAMRLIWQRMKIIVEPSSAIALAVLIKERALFENKKVGIILSGGNVDLDNLPFE